MAAGIRRSKVELQEAISALDAKLEQIRTLAQQADEARAQFESSIGAAKKSRGSMEFFGN